MALLDVQDDSHPKTSQNRTGTAVVARFIMFGSAKMFYKEVGVCEGRCINNTAQSTTNAKCSRKGPPHKSPVVSPHCLRKRA